MTIQSHPRSMIFVSIDAYVDFLLVINNKLGPIPRFVARGITLRKQTTE